MLSVSLTGALRSAVGGAECVQIQASSIRELISNLSDQYPNIRQHIDTGIAVAIDGKIYRDNWDVEISADAEVFLLPRIQGG
ncbi:MAG: MoaD/ThiS family protein [Halieaceae bacterium]|jgi:sulfur-carrier protein|nr:MoaD/ThiS family protein [Halieaceae bacterium]